MSKSTLWAVAMRPEGHSPFKQTPAASKELADRAVERYRKMHEKEGNNFFLEIFDDVIKVQKWHGTRKDHIRNLFYVESWFTQAMYQCFDLMTAERVFKFDEIVNCYKKGSVPLVTKSFDEAKLFYGFSETGFKYQIQPIEPPENLFNWFHPDIELFDTIEEGVEAYTREQWAQLQVNLRVEIETQLLDYDEIPNIPEDAVVWPNWKPEPPEQGLFLIAAFDSENGPVLWWANPKAESKEG